MKIKFQPPRPCEARVSSANGELTISPIFSSEKGRKTCAYVTVTGALGCERLYTLEVSATTGRLSLQELCEVVPHFDLSTFSDGPDADRDPEAEAG